MDGCSGCAIASPSDSFPPQSLLLSNNNHSVIPTWDGREQRNNTRESNFCLASDRRDGFSQHFTRSGIKNPEHE